MTTSCHSVIGCGASGTTARSDVMARYRIEVDKCVGKKPLKVVDTAILHVNAPNMREADNKLDKLLTEEPGYTYLIYICTDNKKKDKK